VKTRLFRVVLILIGASILLSSAGADAEPQPGLTVTVYNNYGYNNAPPLPEDDRVVGTTVFSGINQNFDSNPIFNMYEDFAVKYEGFITLPCTCAVQLLALADDGTILYLDDQQITYDWYDKGNGGTISQPIEFEQDVSKKITLWFYENGGGAWVQLLWNLNEQWVVVPDSAFTQVAVTTTVATTTTSTQPTTTTLEPTTTTTSEPVVPSTVEPSTTVVQTTTSSSVPTETQTTLGLPPTTVPETTVPETTTLPQPASTFPVPATAVTVPASSSTYAPTTTQQMPTTTTLNSIPTSTTTIPETINKIQALEIATSPEAVAELTAEEATEVFATLDVSELSEEEAAALVEAVQEAPQEVREAFESEVNIFSGAVDTYVPVGSTIPVSQRRALIVVAVTIMAAPMLTSRKW